MDVASSTSKQAAENENLYKFECDEEQDDGDVSTDLDSDELSCSSEEELEGAGEEKARLKRLEMDLVLRKTKRYYHALPYFDDARRIKYGSASCDVKEESLTDEFVSSGLESLDCDRLNAAADLNSRYRVESLSESHRDHKTILEAVENVDASRVQPTKILPFNTRITTNRRLRLSKVIRVVSNRSDAPKRSRDNKLLYHGTRCYSLVNVLNRGLVPSKEGRYGEGVYLTNGIDLALDYGSNKGIESKYVFVVEVVGSFEKFPQKKTGAGRKKPAWVEINLVDSRDCRICKELKWQENTQEVGWRTGLSAGDIFVTRQNFAVPAYLMKFDYD